MKKAVVTGGTGAVGRALIALLLERGVEVLLLYRKESERIAELSQLPRLKLLACAQAEYATLTLADRYDAFFHLAWEGSYGAARDEQELQQQNARYAADAAALAARLSCRVFVGAGSQAEYGDIPMGTAAHPDMACSPKTAYGAAKLEACGRSLAVCRLQGVRHVWARLFSVYGEYDRPQTLVMQAIAAFSEGKDGNFTKGEQIWDYLHAADAARALFHLAKEGKDGKIYNVASGKPCPLAAFITQIRDEVAPHCAAHLGAVPYFAEQAMNLRADISDLVRDTGFAPQISFAEGIRRTLRWYRASVCQQGTKR